MNNHISIGKLGESLAKDYLQNQGYQILEQNWRYKRTEVDLIAMKDEILVFIEVKTRSSAKWGEPEIAVSNAKEERLRNVSGIYMQLINHHWEVRFDIISIVLGNISNPRITHFKDAFI